MGRTLPRRIAEDAKKARDLAAGNQPGNNPGGGRKPNSSNGGNSGYAQGEPGKDGGSGMGGPGRGYGGRAESAAAPFTMKRQVVEGAASPDGKDIAKSYIKADPVTGKSTIEVTQADLDRAHQESADEVQEETVSKDGQRVVKEYFDDLQKK